MDQIKWWGYIHTNGKFIVKRYFDWGEIEEAKESTFCTDIFGPTEANTRDEAIIKLKTMVDIK